MFKGIISRDHGEPWGPTGMTSKKWLDVPTRPVPIADLVATQPQLSIPDLIAPGVPVGGDPYPHVVQWRGENYLEDGHHRVTRAAVAGQTHIIARVLVIRAWE